MKSERKLKDSITQLIKVAENDQYSDDERLEILQRADRIAQGLKNDSIQLETTKQIRNYYFDMGQMDDYIQSNQKIKNLAVKIADSSSLGNAYDALGFSYFHTGVKDSSYHYYLKAVNVFDEINDNIFLSNSLSSLATLQVDGKDYFGADENAIKALRLLEGVQETNIILDRKWILYNLLGNIADAIGENEKALEYHDEALKVAKRMENDYNNGIYSLNNIAYVKRKQGLYAESKEIFKEVLSTSNLYEDDPSFYALILENLAFTEFLTGTYDRENIVSSFEKSYAIADSLNDDLTKTGTVISMAKFYNSINEKDKALNLAEEAYQLSKNLEVNEILFQSMLLLAELNEGETSKRYFNEHIKLSDSLLNVERNVRNKFARIELETEELEAKNKQISKENLYLLILSMGLMVTAVLSFIIVSQRAKNRKLKLNQVQQKANEDIYNLMLIQQDKVDEARAKEKMRVSKELHDGVLGRLFGTRLSLDSINLKEGKEAELTRANYISQLKIIEEDIRKISHELNTDFVSGSGFMEIVSELIRTQTEAYDLEYEFNYTDDISWDLVSNKTKINIYRIIQESMQNIYKHANAQTVEISISLEKNLICLDIIDDGDGFDTTKSRKGIGVKNMESRVKDISGSVSFTSQSGHGTKVNVKIPYINQST
ncbi:two-component sensor histidine kinase [Winogradskyella epiphytica]|nr:two-component sensor histidine kinase [Winogradskyella epiphytica]